MILHREIESGLAITPVHPYLVDDIYNLIDSDRKHLRRWLCWVDASVSPDSTRAFIENALTDLAEKTAIIWAILVEGEVKGIVSFFNINWPAGRAEIGYWLASDATGKGVMSRCVSELERLGFNELGLEKIEIRCAEGNTPSRGIPERLGYRTEGVQRRGENLYGEILDHIIYGKLKNEWSD